MILYHKLNLNQIQRLVLITSRSKKVAIKKRTKTFLVSVALEKDNLLNFEQYVNKALEIGFQLINCSEGSKPDERHVYVAFLLKKK